MNSKAHATTRNFLISLWIAAASSAFFAGSPAVAQPAGRNVEIVAFEVEPLQQLAPGSTLLFRVRGTPGGRATVRVSGLAPVVTLHETASGLYEGSHILRRQDRLNPRATATATLRVGARTSSATLARLTGAAPVAAQRPAPAPAPAAPTTYVVSRFTVTPEGQIGPGAVLRFALEGTPGGEAVVTIDGVSGSIGLPEVRPGYYEGSYTVQPQDQLIVSSRAVASLQEPRGAAPARALAAAPGASAPAVHSVLPKEGASVPAGGPVSISGRFGDPGSDGVDPKSVRISIAGRDVTRDASITASTFMYRAELRPGTYAVEVTARDTAGQTLRHGWQFTVGGSAARASALRASASGELPLEITSHLPNATVQPGRIVVSGRTSPGIEIGAQVKAVAPGSGDGAAGEVLYNNRWRSDANGDFRFSFQPQTPVHGTRYEIDLQATDRGQSKSARLLLFQQR